MLMLLRIAHDLYVLFCMCHVTTWNQTISRQRDKVKFILQYTIPLEYCLIKAFIKHVGGLIIAITVFTGRQPFPPRLFYCTKQWLSKVIKRNWRVTLRTYNLTRYLSDECSSAGVETITVLSLVCRKMPPRQRNVCTFTTLSTRFKCYLKTFFVLKKMQHCNIYIVNESTVKSRLIG